MGKWVLLVDGVLVEVFEERDEALAYGRSNHEGKIRYFTQVGEHAVQQIPDDTIEVVSQPRDAIGSE
ncbi:MAG: hypothetical protein H6774_04310 [Pseudomonadales bacterium]|nr:hypothetical protein [Pseudomonadales bacterium]